MYNFYWISSKEQRLHSSKQRNKEHLEREISEVRPPILVFKYTIYCPPNYQTKTSDIQVQVKLYHTSGNHMLPCE